MEGFVGILIGAALTFLILVGGCGAIEPNGLENQCRKFGYYDLTELKRLKCSVEQKIYVETKDVAK